MERMKNSSIQFAAYLALLTVGMALIITGIQWLSFVGLALAIASGFFSSHWKFRPRGFTAVFICLAGAVWLFAADWRDGSVFNRKPMEWWFIVIFAAAWLWSIFREYRCWRASRSITHDA